jgi:maleate cis-trans isomerase
VVAITKNPNIGATRIGLIIPSVNAVIEPEFARIAPEGFSFHAARVMLRETTPDGLRAMNTEVASAARLVASVDPKAVAYACTSGSFLEGAEATKRQLAEIAAITGCPVIATSAAMIEGLRKLGIRKIALATPYLDVLNEIEKAYFESHGFEVVSVRGMQLSGKAIREVQPDRVFEFVKTVDRKEAEAVFVSCTDLRAIEAVPALEAVLGKPVLTSNSVTLWALMRACGQAPRRADLGRLFA